MPQQDHTTVSIPEVGDVDFPSSMSSAEINAAAKKLYEGRHTTALPAPKFDTISATPLRELLTTMHSRDPRNLEENVLGNIGASAMGPFLHPIDTAKSLFRMTVPGMAYDLAKGRQSVYGEMGQQAKEHPEQFIEGLIGQSALGEVGAEAIGALAPRVKLPSTEGVRSSPRIVKKLVEQTEEANKGITAKNAEAVEAHKQATAKADAENSQLAKEHEQAVQVVDAENTAKLKKYRNETEAVAADNAARNAKYEAEKGRVERLKQAAEEQGTHQQRLSRQIKETGTRLVNRVRGAQENAKAAIDKQWDDLRQRMSGAEVPREQLADLVRSAETRLAGSSENIKVFHDILNKSEEPTVKLGGAASGVAEKSHPLYQQLVEAGAIEEAKPATFKDLQGYYSELGEKLSSGSLPGDVYQAIKSLQGGISDIMQRLAAERGQSAALNAARAKYRDYMQTFRELSGPNHSGSPIAEALAAKDPAYAVAPLLRDETAARVRSSLVRFDKDVHGAASILDNLRSDVRAFDAIKPVKVPKAPTPPKVTSAPEYPGLKPRPEKKTVATPEPPKLAPRKTVSAEDVTQAKRDQYQGKVEQYANYGHKLAVVLPILYLMKDAMRLSLPENAALVPATAGLSYAVFSGLRNVFERPAVVKFFSDATAKDVAQIPPDIRGDMPAIIQQAERRGIRVSPDLHRAFVGTTALAPRKNPTDEWAQQ